MSAWISTASVVGALGLFVAGQLWIVAGLRVVLPRFTARLGPGIGRSGSYGLGFGTSLISPTHAWSAQSVLSSVHGAGRSLEGSLWQTLGASLALAWTAWCAVAVQSAAGGFEPVAWTLLGIGGLVSSAVPRLRAPLWLALGSGACLLSMLHLDQAFAALGGARIDAWGLAMPVRCVVAALLGAAIAALLRSPGALVLATVYAADHRALHISTAVALFIGASLGSLAATIPAWRPEGTAAGRRIALGWSAFHGVASMLMIFVLALGLPLLGDLPAPLDRPLWLLATWISIVLAGATLICIPLVGPGARLLENRLGLLGSDSTRSKTLDATTLAVPTLAFESLQQEIDSMRSVTASLARRVLGEERVSDFRVQRDITAVAQRAQAVTHFTDELLGGEISGPFLRACERMPTVSAVYLHVCRQMDALRRPDMQPANIPDSPLRARVLQYRWSFLHFLERGCIPEAPPREREHELHQIEVHRSDLVRRIVGACWQQSLDPGIAHATLESIETLRATAQALFFAMGDAQVEPPAAALTPTAGPAPTSNAHAAAPESMSA